GQDPNLHGARPVERGQPAGFLGACRGREGRCEDRGGFHQAIVPVAAGGGVSPRRPPAPRALAKQRFPLPSPAPTGSRSHAAAPAGHAPVHVGAHAGTPAWHGNRDFRHGGFYGSSGYFPRYYGSWPGYYSSWGYPAYYGGYLGASVAYPYYDYSYYATPPA